MAAAIAACFFLIGLVLARPDQTLEIAIYGLGVLMLFTVGIYKWHAARQEVARLLDIVQRGVDAEAQVESMQVSQIHAGGAFPLELGWIASYSFLDRRGNRHYGESGYLSRHVAQRYRSGDRVKVIFDPNDPEMSVWAEPS